MSEWTGLGLGEALQKAEDREEWRKVVAPPSLMPNGYSNYSMTDRSAVLLLLDSFP